MHFAAPSFPMRAGNAVHFLTDPKVFLPDMLEGIAGAKRSIDLTTFVLEPTGSGAAIVDAIIDARRANPAVHARVGYDQAGSSPITNVLAEGLPPRELPGGWAVRREAQRDMVDRLRSAGVDVVTYPRVSLEHGIGWIDHRKALVVDDASAWIGGANFSERFDAWHDLMVRVDGPLASDVTRDLQLRFTEFGLPSRAVVTGAHQGSAAVQLLANHPPDHLAATDALRSAFGSAQQRIVLQTPFFSHDGISDDIERAAAAGVPTTLITNKVTGALEGNPMTKASKLVTQLLARDLLAAGGRVFEHPADQYTHLKSWIADGVAHVGSPNATNRALARDHELLLRSADPDFVAQADALVAADLLNSREVSLAELDSTRMRWLAEMRDRHDLQYVVGRERPTP